LRVVSQHYATDINKTDFNIADTQQQA